MSNTSALDVSCQKTTLPFLVNLYKIPVKCCFLPLCEGVTLGFFPFSYSFCFTFHLQTRENSMILATIFPDKMSAFPHLPLELPQEILDVLSYQRKPNLHERNSPGNSAGNLFGMVK